MTNKKYKVVLNYHHQHNRHVGKCECVKCAFTLELAESKLSATQSNTSNMTEKDPSDFARNEESDA